MARLYQKYKNEIVGNLKKTLKLKNVYQVPKIEKVVINMGVGKASQDVSFLDEAEAILTNITGQKPLRAYAKKAIAGFKLRKGLPLGCKVTLRGNIMYEFIDRLINIALPGVKDFRGIPVKFDGSGNYTLGWKDHTIFPEVNIDAVKNTYGMDICFVTTANTDEEGFALLKELGFPFRKN
ncbi:MAG: hypothetical protein ACD_79C01488G0007 [uncultured bacterium]|nr:MAG: hypothetical protein ACD_79C01488G0007 [uncultured bacterium]